MPAATNIGYSILKGLAWEHFLTLGEVPIFGEDSAITQTDGQEDLLHPALSEQERLRMRPARPMRRPPLLRTCGAKRLMLLNQAVGRGDRRGQCRTSISPSIGQKLLAFIQQRVGSRELAQDILHDVFVKILGREDCLREPAKITAWLYQVTRNAIIDRFRSNRFHEELPQEIPANDEESTAEARLAGFLRPMIETLPAIYRDALILSDIDGLRLKQIAEREGLTVSAVKSRVQRGRRMLEAMLRDCCTLEFSSRGEIMDFWPKSAGRVAVTIQRAACAHLERNTGKSGGRQASRPLH